MLLAVIAATAITLVVYGYVAPRSIETALGNGWRVRAVWIFFVLTAFWGVVLAIYLGAISPTVEPDSDAPRPLESVFR